MTMMGIHAILFLQ